MKHLLLIILSFFVFGNSFSQEPNWFISDEVLIKDVVKIYNDAKLLEAYFFIKNKHIEKSNLGFGYSYKGNRIGAEQIAIECDFYYFNDSLISYVLKPELPNKKSKHKQYLKWYDNKFEHDESGNLLAHYYNYEQFSKPFYFYPGRQINSEKIDYYMSPESGLSYGCRGGYSNSYLNNRRLFVELKPELTKNIILQLMCSINPATRLTAIETYYKYPHLFSIEKPLIDWWINRVYKKAPITSTMIRCIPYSDSTKILVHKYALFDCESGGITEVVSGN